LHLQQLAGHLVEHRLAVLNLDVAMLGAGLCPSRSAHSAARWSGDGLNCQKHQFDGASFSGGRNEMLIPRLLER
jgi:hypothetical protein